MRCQIFKVNEGFLIGWIKSTFDLNVVYQKGKKWNQYVESDLFLFTYVDFITL